MYGNLDYNDNIYKEIVPLVESFLFYKQQGRPSEQPRNGNFDENRQLQIEKVSQRFDLLRQEMEISNLFFPRSKLLRDIAE